MPGDSVLDLSNAVFCPIKGFKSPCLSEQCAWFHPEFDVCSVVEIVTKLASISLTLEGVETSLDTLCTILDTK